MTILGGSSQMETLKLPEYTVIDLETSIKNRGELAIGSKASPFHKDNNIVLFGIKTKGYVQIFETFKHQINGDDLNLLVGQNIKFDLLYMLKHFNFQSFHQVRLWDTMIVEYLITGQQHKYWSLDKLAGKYDGCTLKDDTIKEYWDKDVDTEDIPKEELIPYLQGDLNNTDIIFKAQWKRVNELGMLPLVEAQMDALKATTIMEFNGMHFDIDLAYKKAADLHTSMLVCEGDIKKDMHTMGIVNPNPASNEHISLLLFGGEQKVEVQQPVLHDDGSHLRYKTGKRKGEFKWKKGIDIAIIKGHPSVSRFDGQPTSKKGFYKVGDEQLNSLWGESHDPELVELISVILEYRTLAKDLNTYFIGFAKHYWEEDKKIHGSISHCGTATGRLSSNKPNLQNLTSKD